MHRRDYLATMITGASIAIAGCGGSGENSGFGDGDGVEQVSELTRWPYWDMDISSNGRSMVTANSEAIRLHQAGGNSRKIVESDGNSTVFISESGDSILATEDGTFTNYDTNGEQQWEQQITEFGIDAIDATSDFETVVVGNESFVEGIGEDGNPLWEDSLPAGRISGIEVSESGEYVAVRTKDRPGNSSNKHAIHVYNDGEHLWSKEYDVPPLQVDISDSSEIVAVGLDDVRLLVYDLNGELSWEKSSYGGYFKLSDNGELILAQDITNTVIFSPEGDEVWNYEMPDSEFGVWLYDRMDVSNMGRSIGSYENISNRNSTVNMYDEGGEVIWQSDYESKDVYVSLSQNGSTWMVNTSGQIEIYHDYNLID